MKTERTPCYKVTDKETGFESYYFGMPRFLKENWGGVADRCVITEISFEEYTKNCPEPDYFEEDDWTGWSSPDYDFNEEDWI